MLPRLHANAASALVVSENQRVIILLEKIHDKVIGIWHVLLFEVDFLQDDVAVIILFFDGVQLWLFIASNLLVSQHSFEIDLFKEF